MEGEWHWLVQWDGLMGGWSKEEDYGLGAWIGVHALRRGLRIVKVLETTRNKMTFN